MEQKVIRSKILIPLIEDSYRAEYTEYARRNLRCSDAGAAADEGEKCEREIFYDMTIPEKKSLLSNGTLVLFDDGRIHESDIRRRLRLVLRSPERELKDEEIQIGGRPTSGKIDNTAEIFKLPLVPLSEIFPDTSVLGLKALGDPVLELKSVNEWSYQAMATSGQINQSYYDQIQEYLFLTGATWAICLIKNRNSTGDEKGALPFLEFVVLPDPARQAMIRAGLKTTAECVEKKIMPPRPFLMESTKCQYCRFKYECWGDALNVKEPAFEIKEEGPAPDQEMVESALKVYATVDAQIGELEGTKEQAKAVLLRFFRATKLPETQVADIKATYSASRKRYIDKLKVLAALGLEKYSKVSKPVKELLEQAVADRLIDAKVLEDVMVFSKEPSEYLRVGRIKPKTERVKGEQNDKGNIGSKKDSAPRKDTARDKGKNGAGKRVPKRSGLLHPRSGSPKSGKARRVNSTVS